MKKVSIILIFIIIVLSLSAWGSGYIKSNSSKTNSSVEVNSLSPMMELAMGTLRLEGTSQAINKESAEKLLPYWQLMEELSTSSAAASQEKSVVVENIKALMTVEQVQAIDDMELTQRDVALVLQTSGSTNDSSNTKINSSVIPGEFTGGGVPPAGGGVPIDIGGMGGGALVSTSSQQSNSNSQISNAAASASLINQVINLLESRINN